MKRIFAILITLLICIVSVCPVFAANDLVINGQAKAKKGNKVTYELNLGDCEEDILGLQMYINFDSEKLKVIEDSLNFPEINGVVSNCTDDYIVFNWTNVSNLLDFSEKKVLATVDFKVLKDGETSIEYFVEEMYGMDMTYLKSYTFTYNLLVNGDTEIEDDVPPIVEDKDFVNNAQGGFINYVDGKGEENGAEGHKDNTKATTSTNNKKPENKPTENKVTENKTEATKKNDDTKRETIMGTTQAPSKEEVGEVVDSGDTIGETSPKGLPTAWLVGGVLVFLVIVIVVLVVLNNRVKKKKSEKTFKQEKED